MPSSLEPNQTPLSAQTGSAVSAPDRLPFYAGATFGASNVNGYAQGFGPAPGSYGPPTLGSTPGLLARPGSWSQQPSAAPTAITALLTENKCPRHGTSGYCVGGNCLS